jgi:hypothetical protein
MANGQALPAGRRTSFAFGHDGNRDTYKAEAEKKRADKRAEVRKKLAERMLSSTRGKSAEEAVTILYKEMMDGSKGEGISFKLLKRYLDRNGLNVLHEDGQPLFDSMDLDNNGTLDQHELRVFLETDHDQAREDMLKRLDEEARFKAQPVISPIKTAKSNSPIKLAPLETKSEANLPSYMRSTYKMNSRVQMNRIPRNAPAVLKSPGSWVMSLEPQWNEIPPPRISPGNIRLFSQSQLAGYMAVHTSPDSKAHSPAQVYSRSPGTPQRLLHSREFD